MAQPWLQINLIKIRIVKTKTKSKHKLGVEGGLRKGIERGMADRSRVNVGYKDGRMGGRPMGRRRVWGRHRWIIESWLMVCSGRKGGGLYLSPMSAKLQS